MIHLSSWNSRATALSGESLTCACIPGALLLQDSKLRALDPTSPRDFKHVFSWIYGHKPLDSGEYDFILHRDDFVSSDKGSSNPFERLVESCLSRWPNMRLRVSKPEPSLSPHNNK
jgi:hypothetical protein